MTEFKYYEIEMYQGWIKGMFTNAYAEKMEIIARDIIGLHAGIKALELNLKMARIAAEQEYMGELSGPKEISTRMNK